MTTRNRFTLLLALLLGGFVGASLVLQQLAQLERDSLLSSDRQARGQFLNHWLDAVSRELPQVTGDLALSEEFAGLLRNGDIAEGRRKIGSTLVQSNAAALWILRVDGSVFLRVTSHDDAEPPPLPFDASEIARLLAETPSPRFFAKIGPDLFEFCVRRLQVGAQRDWVMVARAWDNAQLQMLSALTDSAVTLRPAHEMANAAGPDSKFALLRPLNDWRGNAAGVLRIEYDLPELKRTLRSDWRQLQVFLVFGLLVLAAMVLALQSWVLRPLRKIRDSLAAGNGDTVKSLSAENTEFGGVAKLVLSSFAQQEDLRMEIVERKRIQDALTSSEAALRHNIEERARLGRDLHDGVIQSLYAAGMGLAGIRAHLNPEQTEAASQLDQTRDALNETIHDVRNFIVGLEPEALKIQSFSHAVGTLLESMRAMRPFQSSVRIDDSLATRLTLSQRAHALQIAREAVSNALRHGEADHLEIVLRQQGKLVEFDVADNGRGFDATSSEQPGNGLSNFVQRARELGAELRVQSQPGRGTRVQLSFSLL